MRPASLLALLLFAAPALAQPGWVAVETDVPGARLWVDDEPLGPLPAEPLALAAGTYRLAVVEGDPALWNPRRAEATVEVAAGDTLHVRLALGLAGYDGVRHALGSEAEPLAVPLDHRRTSYAVEAGALGVAVAAAAVSILLKREADRRYDVYAQTGDPDLRPGVLRYDRYAGAALAVSALGFGTVAVRLALR